MSNEGILVEIVIPIISALSGALLGVLGAKREARKQAEETKKNIEIFLDAQKEIAAKEFSQKTAISQLAIETAVKKVDEALGKAEGLVLKHHDFEKMFRISGEISTLLRSVHHEIGVVVANLNEAIKDEPRNVIRRVANCSASINTLESLFKKLCGYPSSPLTEEYCECLMSYMLLAVTDINRRPTRSGEQYFHRMDGYIESLKEMANLVAGLADEVAGDREISPALGIFIVHLEKVIARKTSNELQPVDLTNPIEVI